MPSPRSSEYVDLNRTFRQLHVEATADDDQRIDLTSASGKSLNWLDLLKEYRVVILSEAGSGKTEELRQTTKRLRVEGKNAFFLRLENVCGAFADAFDEGSNEEFNAWLKSTDEAWLFLDSVDEARLKSPKDFEQAIRTASSVLGASVHRAHIILSSRASAWRPFTDLRFCQEKLPIEPEGPYTASITDPVARKNVKEELTESVIHKRFQIYTLEDLNDEQIARFSEARGLQGSSEFIEALRQSQAMSLASRPLDLRDLVEKWKAENRIGSRLEMIRDRINSRLLENDQNRAEGRPMTHAQARSGAMLMAAATTLAGEQEIGVPDGIAGIRGIEARSVLTAWTDHEVQTLLQRPIFDEEVYGSVRFHHRSVREYLAAEWFAGLLAKSTSRRTIESLFFRVQYGEPILTRSLRPILPWLILLDEGIRDRVLHLEPELVLEGGDPSQLPLEVRAVFLSKLCSRIASGFKNRETWEGETLAQFASNDLAPTVCELFGRYANDDEVIGFLLLLVWKGRIAGPWTEVETIALSIRRSPSSRQRALYAANVIGSEADLAALRGKFFAGGGVVDRQYLSIILEGIPSAAFAAQWLLSCLEKTQPKERYSYDALEYELPRYVARMDKTFLPEFLYGVSSFLNFDPDEEFAIDPSSHGRGWMFRAACQAVLRLILDRDSAALSQTTLAVLRRLDSQNSHRDRGLEEMFFQIQRLIPAWQELNWALFWFNVDHTRKWLETQCLSPLVNWAQVRPSGLWQFTGDDFSFALRELNNRSLLDDKMVALTLACSESLQSGGPLDWLLQLQQATEGHQELLGFLVQMLGPRIETPEYYNRLEQAKQRKQDREKRLLDAAENLEEAKEYFNKSLETLRLEVSADPNRLHQNVGYLFSYARSLSSSHSRHTTYNWMSLEPDFGPDVAHFYRDTVRSFWRNHSAVLRSEGAHPNQVAGTVLIGLAGLEIEFREYPESFQNLSELEIDRACRMASFEMNGYPDWFPTLFANFSDQVGSFLLQEIDYELESTERPGSVEHILRSLVDHCKWAWDWLAPHLLDRLQEQDVLSPGALDSILRILRGSARSDDELAQLARKKSRQQDYSLETRSCWYASWVGSDPADAIADLETFLGTLTDSVQQTNMAMQFLTRLLGGRRDDSVVAREGFRKPEHLKSLYFLMHRYIRVEEDIDRSKSGVYSPELRDQAQDARGAIFSMLEQIPGKAAHQALCDIANWNPSGYRRSWILYRAKEKAVLDGDIAPWSPDQVVEFHSAMERTPRNHNELTELAEMRLLDLKDDIEDGDNSLANLLRAGLGSEIIDETGIRNFIGRELRDKARNRYSVSQEDELADGKRPDLRFYGVGFDGPVPVELKLADKWSGPDLFERLENQLCGDYLRDPRSTRGIFLLVYHGKAKSRDWLHPVQNVRINFPILIQALREHWNNISANYPGIDHVSVIGIDLTERTK